LKSKGFKVVGKNYRFARAEVDLIAKDEKNMILVFAEVKTRRSREFAEAEDSVGELKYHQIMKAAEGFVAKNRQFEDYEKRFDIVSVYINGRDKEINHLEDVF
jgi:putative endonuclease